MVSEFLYACTKPPASPLRRVTLYYLGLGASTAALAAWFAADPELLNVMVQYAGPYGVEYRLKKLGRWAYWDRGAPRP